MERDIKINNAETRPTPATKNAIEGSDNPRYER